MEFFFQILSIHLYTNTQKENVLVIKLDSVIFVKETTWLWVYKI